MRKSRKITVNICKSWFFLSTMRDPFSMESSQWNRGTQPPADPKYIQLLTPGQTKTEQKKDTHFYDVPAFLGFPHLCFNMFHQRQMTDGPCGESNLLFGR